MGHSQSYDLKNKELDEKTRDPVRGVKRVSKEHQTDYSGEESIESLDHRETELRDRIRQEQLRKREDELETWRVKQHESRDPIIDAYRSTTPAAQPGSFTEFNYYDSLKHSHPVDPTTYHALKPRKEVNGGDALPLKRVAPVPVPMDPSPAQKHTDYPQTSTVFSGRLSPLSRNQEVDPHPMPRYVPPMAEPRYDVPVGTYSKTTTVTTYTHFGNRAAFPQYDSVPQSVPKYDQVPTEAPSSPTSSSSVIKFPRADVPATEPNSVPIRTVPSSPRQNVPQYDEVPLLTPVLTGTPVSTVPSSQSVPKYDEVPPDSNPVTYDEVPDEKYTVTLPASTNATYSKKNKHYHVIPDVPYATYSTRGHKNIPIYVLPPKNSHTLVIPIRAEKLESLERAQEVSETPLGSHVKSRAPSVPVSPRERVVSRGSEVTRETVYATVPRATAPRTSIIRRKPSIIEATTRKTPTPTPPLSRQSDARGTPIEHYIAQREPTVTSRPTSTPPSVLNRQSEVRGTPVEHYVAYRTVTPVTVPSQPTPPPVSVLNRQSEVRGTPVGHYVTYRTSTPATVPSRPTPPPVSEARRTPTPVSVLSRQSEVRGTPVEHYVTLRTPSPVSLTYSVHSSVSKSSYTALDKQSDIRRTPLNHYVSYRTSTPVTKLVVPPSPTPDYSNLPVVRAGPYGTRPVTPPEKGVYLERRHSEIEKLPLERYCLRREVPRYAPYRTPSLSSTRYSSPPATLYRTQLQPEVRRTPPIYHYVTNYRIPREHMSELHAEKRMIYEVPDDNVTYVKVADFPTYSATSSVTSSPSPRAEPLYREIEVVRHPIQTLPSQVQYEKLPKVVVPRKRSNDKETQYSRRPSEDAVLDYPRYSKPLKTCHVENCTHVEVRDTPVVARRTISEEPKELDHENRLTIFVEKDENDMRNVVDLARDEDVGPMTSQSRRCLEEKLYYDGYMPTLSLDRRPIVSFYDKLH